MNVSNKEVVKDGAVPSVTGNSGNAAIKVGIDATMKVVSPSIFKETVSMECPVVNTPDVGLNPSLPTQEANSTSNAPSKPSYATATGKPSRKKVNVYTLFTPGVMGLIWLFRWILFVLLVNDLLIQLMVFSWGRRWHTLLLLTMLGILGVNMDLFAQCSARLPHYFSFQFSFMDGLDAMLENGPWFIRNNPLILKKWHPDENLLKEDVSTVPVGVKLHSVPVTAFSEDGLSAIATKLGTPLMLDSYTSDMYMQSWGRSSYARVMYEWKPLRCSSCKVFGHIHEECTKNTGAGEKKNVKKPSKNSRGVLVGPKMGFKPQKEYRPVPKKPNASSSGNKKKGVEPIIEVSNSNPFDVLNSVDNDEDFGTNRGTTNLVNNEATSSGSSFMNIDNDGEFASNTPISGKIDKIERQIGEAKLRLLDNHENPLVPTGIVESDSKVEAVFDETANLRISTSGKDGSGKLFTQKKYLHRLLNLMCGSESSTT
ncbi:nucleotide-diphospho-sugar transferase [Tanacetum coccineum]